VAITLKDCQNLSFPLVSVGIPTYNRASSLRKAVDSVLAQDYPNLELIISDNASTDETQALCQELCERDKRVRYIRQITNLGPTANFNEVLTQSQGEFFMWLGDDDWLNDSYISHCVKVLVEHPDYSLVSGRAKYFRDGIFIDEGVQVNLLQHKGGDRVLSYYSQVAENGTFYGVMRREQLSKLSLQNSMGGDWLLIASIAFMGKIGTLEDTSVNRNLGGATDSYKKIASSLNLSKFEGDNPHLSIAKSAFKDIAQVSPAYVQSGRVRRLFLACRASALIFHRFIANPQLFRIRLLVRKTIVYFLAKLLPKEILEILYSKYRKVRNLNS
jgi:glycosyltransferase involved in cell wall biosynthesis